MLLWSKLQRSPIIYPSTEHTQRSCDSCGNRRSNSFCSLSEKIKEENEQKSIITNLSDITDMGGLKFSGSGSSQNSLNSEKDLRYLYLDFGLPDLLTPTFVIELSSKT